VKISRLQARILDELYSGTMPTVSSIAERLNKLLPSISRAMKPLREAGYVVKSDDGIDITKEGMDAYDEALERKKEELKKRGGVWRVGSWP
jgi:Mn-dependent DtxR family transcriptional regulator